MLSVVNWGLVRDYWEAFRTARYLFSSIFGADN